LESVDLSTGDLDDLFGTVEVAGRGLKRQLSDLSGVDVESLAK
jgi:hypothetical protein